jgi:hypothetical protein
MRQEEGKADSIKLRRMEHACSSSQGSPLSRSVRSQYIASEQRRALSLKISAVPETKGYAIAEANRLIWWWVLNSQVAGSFPRERGCPKANCRAAQLSASIRLLSKASNCTISDAVDTATRENGGNLPKYQGKTL